MPFHKLLLLIFIFASVLLNAQGYETSVGGVAMSYYQDGEAALLAKDYKAAVRYFKKALRVKEDFLIVHRLLGQCYTLMGDYEAASQAYTTVIEQDSLFSRTIYFDLADTYYKMGDAHQALSLFKTFERLQEKPIDVFSLQGVEELSTELVLKDRLANNIRACEVSIDSVKFINVTDVSNLGSNINSAKDDYFPYLSNDQQQIFFTRQAADKDEDLYYSELNNAQKWKNAERINNFNSKSPEGMSTLVRHGRQMFFTACLRDSVAGPCDIWEAIIAEGNKIESVQSLGAPLNTEYWESQASISCDGSKLFFASNRPDGLGGTDIYMSERLATGLWSKPINLGAPLNTAGDEEAPYISNDGQTLYFSSTGHLGLGEQDIFMSWWDERLKRWSMPINLGPPVNSPHRELGFYLSAEGKTGFFASNRPNGHGGMDIYTFELAERLFGDPITFLEGTLRDSVLKTPLIGVVEINGRPPVMTDNQGRFFLCAGADEMLDFECRLDDYKNYHNQFFIPPWDNKTFYTIDLLLQPKFSFLAEIEAEDEDLVTKSPPKEQVITHSLLFGFDSASLNADELQNLEELVELIKDKNIERIEIVGFADDIGAHSYNLQLSEDRAKHVAVFLLNRNIEVDDIHIEGKGTITQDKKRELNRRVDIKISIKE